jgi:hypothetical protein
VPAEKWTPEQYAAAYDGMSASRGTYNVSGTTFVRRHIADTDPNLEDKLSTGTFTAKGDTFTWQGTDAAGQKFSATYTRMKPFDVYAPFGRGAGAGTRCATAIDGLASHGDTYEDATKRVFQHGGVAGAGLMAGSQLSAQDAPARWRRRAETANLHTEDRDAVEEPGPLSERARIVARRVVGWRPGLRAHQPAGLENGKVLEDFVGEAHNTSGLAVGGGFIWVGCNGAGTASNLREFKRPFDKSYGEIVKLDMKGKQVKGYRTPWGGVHGTYYHKQTDKLWAVAPGWASWPRWTRKTTCAFRACFKSAWTCRTASTGTMARSGSSTAPLAWCSVSIPNQAASRRSGPSDRTIPIRTA